LEAKRKNEILATLVDVRGTNLSDSGSIPDISTRTRRLDESLLVLFNPSSEGGNVLRETGVLHT
jgi:hypothetical protein